ncbi:MAG: flagellar hook-length control protein FliK [Armatimonadetes bacterium]|nr:flagellar hook-length control protein FliK [Armatimonadota bacterium]
MQIADPMASGVPFASSCCCGTQSAAAPGPPGIEIAGKAPDFAVLFADILARLASGKSLGDPAAQPPGQEGFPGPIPDKTGDLTGLTPEQMDAILASIAAQGAVTLPPPLPAMEGNDGVPLPSGGGSDEMPLSSVAGSQGVPFSAVAGSQGVPLSSVAGSHVVPLSFMEGSDGVPLSPVAGNNGAQLPFVPGGDGVLSPSLVETSVTFLPSAEGDTKSLQGTDATGLAASQQGSATAESGKGGIPPGEVAQAGPGMVTLPLPVPSRTGSDEVKNQAASGADAAESGKGQVLPGEAVQAGLRQGTGALQVSTGDPFPEMVGKDKGLLPEAVGKNGAQGKESVHTEVLGKAASVADDAIQKIPRPGAQKPAGPGEEAPAPSAVSVVTGRESPLQSGSNGHSEPEAHLKQPQAMNLTALELSAKGKEEGMSNKAGSDFPVMDALSARTTGASPSSIAQVRTEPVLPPQISEIAQKVARLSVKPDEIKVQLSPPELGKLTIRVTSDEGGLRAFFYTSSHEARAMLQENLGLLKTVLGNQGIQLDGMQVFVGNHPNHPNGRPLGAWAPPVPSLYQREEVPSESLTISQLERRMSKVDCFV